MYKFLLPILFVLALTIQFDIAVQGKASASDTATVQSSVGRVNVAAAANGATATASSTYDASFLPIGAINGDRRGVLWGNGGGWNDATPGSFPDWLEVDFAGTRTIDEVDVFSVQDTFWSPAEPTPSMTFSLYGLSAFTVEYWTGTTWQTVPGGVVSNNTLVWRTVSFTPVSTARIRIVAADAPDGYWTRVAEVEAYETGTDTVNAPPGINVAAAASGATAVASSIANSGFGPAGAINGDRRGASWGNGGGWNDATALDFPDWLEVDFAGAKTIGEIDVFSVQDAFWAPGEPTASMTFSQYGLTDFSVEYWTGAFWQTVPNGIVSGNTLVWRSIAFAPVTTTRIRVVVTGARDGLWSRIAEIEAYETAAAAPGAPTWFVAPGSSGNGTSASPFGRIQDALAAAQPGDIISVWPGTYYESLSTTRSGAQGRPITVRAAGGRGSVLVTAPGRVLTVNHAYIAIEGLILDGQYGPDDLVRVPSGGQFLRLSNDELRRSSRDLIDMAFADGVVIEGSLLHHALNPVDGRSDAHGIAASTVHDLVVRDCEIHTFSGDGIQVDPGRLSPGWSRVTVERTHIWLQPLPAAENGFAAGYAPGENAIDTKASPNFARASIVLRDVVMHGFRNGLLTNMAAFNLKEYVDATVDRVTVYDSEIAFRLRGGVNGTGAWVRIQNAVVHDVLTAFRYEDNIENLRIWNSTVGSGVTRAFQAASSTSSGLDVRNLLLLGPLPPEASAGSNLSVDASAFTDAAHHDYSLAPGSPAIDTGVSISDVTTDRAGTPRPQGAAFDIGAFER